MACPHQTHAEAGSEVVGAGRWGLVGCYLGGQAPGEWDNTFLEGIDWPPQDIGLLFSSRSGLGLFSFLEKSN